MEPQVAGRNKQTDAVWTSGVQTAVIPQNVQTGGYHWGVNVFNRGGIIKTRAGRDIVLLLPDGKAQGWIIFRSIDEVEHFVIAIDGLIYKSDYPFTTYQQLRQFHFNRLATFVYFCEARWAATRNTDGTITVLPEPLRLVVMQDGYTAGGYWDGTAGRHFAPNPINKETPVGTHMCWTGNRLWLAADEKIFVSDYLDPTHFSEGQYLAEADGFQLDDPCTGMIEAPSLQNLLAFSNRDTYMFQSSIQDRPMWQQVTKFQQVLVPGIGAISHRSIYNQYGLTWFFSEHGLTAIDAAYQSNLSSRLDYKDNEMLRSKANLGGNRDKIAVGGFENFLLVSVPSGSIWNKQTWLMDATPIALLSGSSPACWTGVMTGTYPIQWQTFQVRGIHRCFQLARMCRAFNGTHNVIWEDFLSHRFDYKRVPIECWFETRIIKWDGSLWRFKYAEVDLCELMGDVVVEVWYAGIRGHYQKIASVEYHIEEGICGDPNYEPYVYNNDPATDTIFDNFKPQVRYLKTEEQTPRSTGQDTIEAKVESKYNENVDRGFQILVRWWGAAAISEIRLYGDPYHEKGRGECAEDDTGIHVLSSMGTIEPPQLCYTSFARPQLAPLYTIDATQAQIPGAWYDLYMLTKGTPDDPQAWQFIKSYSVAGNTSVLGIIDFTADVKNIVGPVTFFLIFNYPDANQIPIFNAGGFILWGYNEVSFESDIIVDNTGKALNAFNDCVVGGMSPTNPDAKSDLEHTLTEEASLIFVRSVILDVGIYTNIQPNLTQVLCAPAITTSLPGKLDLSSYTWGGKSSTDPSIIHLDDAAGFYKGTPTDQSIVHALQRLLSIGYTTGIRFMCHFINQNFAPWEQTSSRRTYPFASPADVVAGWMDSYFSYEETVLSQIAAAGVPLSYIVIGYGIRSLTLHTDPQVRTAWVKKINAAATFAKGLFPNAVVTYAADWDEYGQGDPNYTLDAVWTYRDIDQVGINWFNSLGPNLTDDPYAMTQLAFAGDDLSYKLSPPLNWPDEHLLDRSHATGRTDMIRTTIDPSFGYKNIAAFIAGVHYASRVGNAFQAMSTPLPGRNFDSPETAAAMKLTAPMTTNSPIVGAIGGAHLQSPGLGQVNLTQTDSATMQLQGGATQYPDLIEIDLSFTYQQETPAIRQLLQISNWLNLQVNDNKLTVTVGTGAPKDFLIGAPLKIEVTFTRQTGNTYVGVLKLDGQVVDPVLGTISVNFTQTQTATIGATSAAAADGLNSTLQFFAFYYQVGGDYFGARYYLEDLVWGQRSAWTPNLKQWLAAAIGCPSVSGGCTEPAASIRPVINTTGVFPSTFADAALYDEINLFNDNRKIVNLVGPWGSTFLRNETHQAVAVDVYNDQLVLQGATTTWVEYMDVRSMFARLAQKPDDSLYFWDGASAYIDRSINDKLILAAQVPPDQQAPPPVVQAQAIVSSTLRGEIAVREVNQQDDPWRGLDPNLK